MWTRACKQNDNIESQQMNDEIDCLLNSKVRFDMILLSFIR